MLCESCARNIETVTCAACGGEIARLGPFCYACGASLDEDAIIDALFPEADEAGEVEEVRDLSTEDIADAEEVDSESDAVSEADAREEVIESQNDAVDSLVNESQEVSDEGVETDGNKRD